MEDTNVVSSAANKCQKAIHSRLIAMLGKDKYSNITKEALDEQKLDFKDLNAYSIIPYTLIEGFMGVEEKELTLKYIKNFRSTDSGKNMHDRIVFIILNFNIPDDETDEEYKNFKDASYICLLLCPEEFPRKPPYLYSVTPNGYYAKDHTGKDGTVICISIGSFHSENYPTTIGITGFSYAAYDMFYNAGKLMGGGGIGHIHMNKNDDNKLRHARVSKEWNIQHFPTVIKAQHLLYRHVPTSYGYDFDIDLYKKPAATVPIIEKTKKSFSQLKRRR